MQAADPWCAAPSPARKRAIELGDRLGELVLVVVGDEGRPAVGVVLLDRQDDDLEAVRRAEGLSIERRPLAPDGDRVRPDLHETELEHRLEGVDDTGTRRLGRGDRRSAIDAHEPVRGELVDAVARLVEPARPQQRRPRLAPNGQVVLGPRVAEIDGAQLVEAAEGVVPVLEVVDLGL